VKRLFVLVLSLAAVMLLASLPRASVEATHPSTPQPILECPDVNGDGPVSGGDIATVVSKFGQTSPDTRAVGAAYHPLYDLVPQTAPGGSISGGDIGKVVAGFGTSCSSGPDTQIAQATLALRSSPDWLSYLTENASFLAGKGYYLSSTDVPGQGKHYINPTYFSDNRFNVLQPEGLVYEGGKLVAQLYYVDGDAVGWGTEPPPIENVEIDAFCTPTPPDTSCSWKLGYDGWHLHTNLCTVAIGSPFAAAIPNVTSDANCQAIHNTWCGGAKCPGTTYRWNDRVGWMGHLWSHMINPNPNPLEPDLLNGRFSDCFPDPWGPGPSEHYTGFSCPQ
jgi:hypothetical protein